MALHTSPAVQHLFQRTMLFSWPGTMQAVPQETASDIHNHFCKVLAQQTSATITNADIHDILITELRIGKYNKKQYDFKKQLDRMWLFFVMKAISDIAKTSQLSAGEREEKATNVLNDEYVKDMFNRLDIKDLPFTIKQKVLICCYKHRLLVRPILYYFQRNQND